MVLCVQIHTLEAVQEGSEESGYIVEARPTTTATGYSNIEAVDITATGMFFLCGCCVH